MERTTSGTDSTTHTPPNQMFNVLHTQPKKNNTNYRTQQEPLLSLDCCGALNTCLSTQTNPSDTDDEDATKCTTITSDMLASLGIGGCLFKGCNCKLGKNENCGVYGCTSCEKKQLHVCRTCQTINTKNKNEILEIHHRNTYCQCPQLAKDAVTELNDINTYEDKKKELLEKMKRYTVCEVVNKYNNMGYFKLPFAVKGLVNTIPDFSWNSTDPFYEPIQNTPVSNVASVITFKLDDKVFVVFQIRSQTVNGGNYRIATPGGAVDANECPQRAAERETNEETGLTSKFQRIGTIINNTIYKHDATHTSNQSPKTGIYFAHATTIPQTHGPVEYKHFIETMNLQKLESYLNERSSTETQLIGQKDIPKEDISNVMKSFDQIQPHIYALGPNVYAAPLEVLVNNDLVWEPSRRCLQLVYHLIKSKTIYADYKM